MKKLLTLAALFICLYSYAQDATKVEQYCEVIASERFVRGRFTVEVNYGEQKTIWKDRELADEQSKLTKYNSVIDALNYMGKQNWKMVNSYSVSTGVGGGIVSTVYHYVLKKDFPKADTEPSVSN